jgi:hypothetical protein
LSDKLPTQNIYSNSLKDLHLIKSAEQQQKQVNVQERPSTGYSKNQTSYMLLGHFRLSKQATTAATARAIAALHTPVCRNYVSYSGHKARMNQVITWTISTTAVFAAPAAVLAPSILVAFHDPRLDCQCYWVVPILKPKPLTL